MYFDSYFTLSNILWRVEKWLLPQELLNVATATAGPGHVTQILPFDPLTRHDVKTICTWLVVIVMANAHTKDRQTETDRHYHSGFCNHQNWRQSHSNLDRGYTMARNHQHLSLHANKETCQVLGFNNNYITAQVPWFMGTVWLWFACWGYTVIINLLQIWIQLIQRVR